MLNALAITGTAILGAITTGVFTLALLAVRTTDQEQATSFAAELPIPQLREPAGRHRAGGERGLSAAHKPRHDWEEVPWSIREGLAGIDDPVARAKELVRQLRQQHYSPWRKLADRRLRVRLQKHAIAQRNGVPMLLGTFNKGVVLP